MQRRWPEQLRTIANAGTLADLKYPNFPDYRQQVQALYQSVNYAPVWVRDGQRNTPGAGRDHSVRSQPAQRA